MLSSAWFPEQVARVSKSVLTLHKCSILRSVCLSISTLRTISVPIHTFTVCTNVVCLCSLPFELVACYINCLRQYDKFWWHRPCPTHERLQSSLHLFKLLYHHEQAVDILEPPSFPALCVTNQTEMMTIGPLCCWSHLPSTPTTRVGDVSAALLATVAEYAAARDAAEIWAALVAGKECDQEDSVLNASLATKASQVICVACAALYGRCEVFCPMCAYRGCNRWKWSSFPAAAILLYDWWLHSVVKVLWGWVEMKSLFASSDLAEEKICAMPQHQSACVLAPYTI